MSLGASLWKASEGFYEGQTLALHGIAHEQEFAQRGLGTLFPKYEPFWRRHVCPATTRPYGTAFRPSISDIVCGIAQKNYSVMCKLLDAADSLAKVQAGDLGDRYRNWRDAIEAAGNALQLSTELQFAVAGNPKKTKASSLAKQLGVTIDPFPDWEQNWAADREMASKYRNYLVHEGYVFTVHDLTTGHTLVLGRAGFAAGLNWKQADASYAANPGSWQPLQVVCREVFGDTVAFIDLTYERLLGSMDSLLTNPAYQQLWGWDHSTPPATWPSTNITTVMNACSTSRTVGASTTNISSGGCMP